MENELYRFTIDAEKEVSKEEIKEIDGENVTVTKKVKENVPVQFVIKKPTRKIIEEGDMQKAIKMSECIKKGIVTKAMLLKKYADTGGILSEEERFEYLKKSDKLMEFQIEFARLTITKKKKKGDAARLKKVISEINKLRNEIAETESSHSNLFDNTADVIALKSEIMFYTLMLTHIEDVKEDETSTLSPFFPGNTYEERVENYYKKEDNPDEFYVKAQTKISYIIAFWKNGAAISQDDFKALEKEIDEGRL